MKQHDPLVTVIIPVATHHIPLLPRAIKSARQQTVPVEVLYLIDHGRRGPGWARNRLAERVRTPFLIMLDADDWLLAHFTETLLKHYRPGSYVYSDWLEGGRHVKATSCYAFAQSHAPDQRGFHLPACLFPTALYHAIGGHDEQLWGAEDTDFFVKANYYGIRSVRVPEPLFVYTSDGARSREASGRGEQWWTLLQSIWERYARGIRMGCCGDNHPKGDAMTAHENDILVRVLWSANERYRGRVTGRDYGRIGHYQIVSMDPRDVNAQPHRFEIVPDIVKLSPPAQVAADALAAQELPVAQAGSGISLAARIAAAGVRNFVTDERPGLDIQQHPEELAAFLDECIAEGAQSCLEIGTGESGGLARFLAQELGWMVVSVDLKTPHTYAAFQQPTALGGKWIMIEGDSAEVNLTDFKFDVVFIDGDHSYEATARDHERFGSLGRIIAFHDIAHDGFFPDGVARYWREIAYTKAGNRRKGFYEVTADAKPRLGIGWYVR